MNEERHYCLICNSDETEQYGKLNSEEFIQHVKDVHPDVPSSEAITATISGFLNDLVEFSDRLDEMAEVYGELLYYAYRYRAKNEIEGAAIKVHRARYEMEKTIGDDGE